MEGKAIVFLVVSLLVIVFLLLLKRNRKNGLNIERKVIHLKSTDPTFESIQFIWITNVGDYRLNKDEIKKICTNNTIIILSGYSKKKSKYHNGENIKFLSSLAPVYYVWSKQDYNGNYRDLNALLLDCKVTILENTSAQFETENGTKFTLIGLDDVETDRDNLVYALEEIEKENINILTSFTEVKNSSEKHYEGIQVYLFEASQTNVIRNQKTIYLELNNDKGLMKQNTISVLNFKVN